MNTGKQINAMVLVLFVLAVVAGAYALWDDTRAENAEEDQLEISAERAAESYAVNCRLCHGDRGEGGVTGGRLPAAPPVDRDDLRGVDAGVFTEDALERAFSFVSNTITCGRVGTQMPTWGQSQGGVLNEEQIRQLTVLITGGDPLLGLHSDEGFWELAQEHADEIDAEATEHATVDDPDGTFEADETELVVTNAAPFSRGQFIRIADERLRVLPLSLQVERGVDGTEAAEHEVGTALLRVDGATQETDETLSEAVDAEVTVFEVSAVREFAAGAVLQLDDERVRVEDVFDGIPTTHQTLVEDIGREPDEFLLSGSENVEPGAIVRFDAELMRVSEIRDDGDAGVELGEDITSSGTRISVSDAALFQPDYVVRIDDERIRVVGQVDTGQLLGDMIGRAETSFAVSGTPGLEEDMVIRIGRELMRITDIQPARVRVERGAPDADGNETTAAAHGAGTELIKPDPAEGEEPDTGQMLLEAVDDGDTTFIVTGTSGITEGESYLIGDERVTVREGGLRPARLRVERAVDGSEEAEHSARVPIFEGNLLDVERGVEGTTATGHTDGTTIFFTEVEVEREVGEHKVQDHSRGAELFLGHRLIVERGAEIPDTTPTEAVDHPNGALVLAFPEAPQAEINNGPACGRRIVEAEQPSEPTPTPVEGQVAVSLVEFEVRPNREQIAPGAGTFNVSNDGNIIHNFRVIATDLPADELPQAGGGVDEEAPDLEVVASIPDFSGGETQTVDVDLPAGNYVLICNVPGHYAAGMRAAFGVTAQ